MEILLGILTLICIGLSAFVFIQYSLHKKEFDLKTNLLNAKLKSMEDFIQGDLATEYDKIMDNLEQVKGKMDGLMKVASSNSGGGSGMPPGLEGLLGMPGVKVSVQGPGGMGGFLEMLQNLVAHEHAPTVDAKDDPSMVGSEEEQNSILSDSLSDLMNEMSKKNFSLVIQNLDKLVNRMQNWINHWLQRAGVEAVRNEEVGVGKHVATLKKHGRQLVEADKLLKTEREEQRAEVYYMLGEIKQELSHN